MCKDNPASPTDEQVNAIAVAYDRTHLGDAKRLTLRFGDDVRYVPAQRSWFVWDDVRFRCDVDNILVERCAAKMVEAIKQEASIMTDLEAQYAHRRHAHRAQGRAHRTAVIRDARTDPQVRANIEDFDPDPWLLNVANGVLDLRTGELQPHCRDLMMSQLAPVTFAPEATCPRWHQFLHETFDGHQGMIGYIQEVLGYAVTGSVTEQSIFVLIGEGGNGKTTMMNTLLTILGDDYGLQAPSDLLVTRRGDTHPTGFADLEGRRAAVASEFNSGSSLDKAKVLVLSGGEKYRARRMNQDYVSITIAAKLFLVTNHLPKISENDEAIRRRLRIIEFPTTPPERTRDPRLLDKLYAERSGILNWLAEGARRVHHDGRIHTPTQVLEASHRALRSLEPLEGFIEGRCEVDPSFEVPATELYHAYRDWHAAHGIEPRLTQQRFGRELTGRGFAQRKSSTMKRVGLRLAPTASPA